MAGAGRIGGVGESHDRPCELCRIVGLLMISFDREDSG